MKKNKYKKAELPLKGKALLAINYGDLIAAGYSASDLIAAGYSASDLIAAGYSASDLIAAGYSLSALRAAGYSASALTEIEKLVKRAPKLKKPYSRLWQDIENKRRVHKQSTWGPESCPAEENLCGTAMCTAGHLVNMAGVAGYELKAATSWSLAAELIHRKAHPNIPPQNFGSIPQELALEYIKQMAAYEEGLEVAR